MESKLLSGVLQTNTTVRLQVADDLLKFLLNDSNTLAGFEDVDQLVTGLLAWLGSSHFKVSQTRSQYQCGWVLTLLCVYGALSSPMPLLNGACHDTTSPLSSFD